MYCLAGSNGPLSDAGAQIGAAMVMSSWSSL